MGHFATNKYVNANNQQQSDFANRLNRQLYCVVIGGGLLVSRDF